MRAHQEKPVDKLKSKPKKDYKIGFKFQGDYKGKTLKGKAKEFLKTAGKQTVGSTKKIIKKIK